MFLPINVFSSKHKKVDADCAGVNFLRQVSSLLRIPFHASIVARLFFRSDGL